MYSQGRKATRAVVFLPWWTPQQAVNLIRNFLIHVSIALPGLSCQRFQWYVIFTLFIFLKKKKRSSGLESASPYATCPDPPLTLRIRFISHLFNKTVRAGESNFLQFLKIIKHLSIANSSLSSALSFLPPSKLVNCVESVRLNCSQ